MLLSISDGEKGFCSLNDLGEWVSDKVMQTIECVYRVVVFREASSSSMWKRVKEREKEGAKRMLFSQRSGWVSEWQSDANNRVCLHGLWFIERLHLLNVKERDESES